MRPDPKQASLAFLLIVSAAGCMESIDSVPEFVQLAERHEREQNFAEAANAYSQAIELAPDDPSLWYDRGVAHLNAGKPKDAVQDYSKAVELDPEFGVAWNNLGDALLQTGDQEAAIDACSRAIEIYRLDPLPRRNRGLAFHQLGLFDLSHEDLTRAIQLDAENAFLFFSRGTTLLDSHRPHSAIIDFVRATELDGTNSNHWIALAVAFSRIGDDAAARQAIETAESHGADGKLKLEELPMHRRPPVPPAVRKNLAEGGYTQDDGLWFRGKSPIRLVFAHAVDGAIKIKQEQRNAIQSDNRANVLVVLQLTENGLQVIKRIDNWNPDDASMTPVEYSMSLDR